MKHLFHILLFLPIVAFPQGTPQGISYQAVAYDSEGFEISNKDISVRLGILLGGVDAEASYTEVHSVTTDDFGLFSLVISEGVSNDDFSSIHWEEGAYLKVEVDANLDGEYSIMGVSSFNAVPYALNAPTNDDILSRLNELEDVINEEFNSFSSYIFSGNDTISLEVEPNKSIVITGSIGVNGNYCSNQLRVTDESLLPLDNTSIKGGGWAMWQGNASYWEHYEVLSSLPSAYYSANSKTYYYSFEVSEPMIIKVFHQTSSEECSGGGSGTIKY